MGILSDSQPLPWTESLEFMEYVKKHGALQFLNILRASRNKQYPEFLWEDEVEYIIVKMVNGYARLSLRTKEILENIKTDIEKRKQFYNSKCNVVPEYGSYHVEATPSNPYGNHVRDLCRVECNMRTRRAFIKQFLQEDEILLTMGNFPRLGAGVFTYPEFPTNGKIAQSDYLPDEIINHHPHFAALTKNIRARRQKKVKIQVPIYHDNQTTKTTPIWMDAVAFGMGCSCLQVTFQARNLDESRNLTDQLAILTPLFMALTAGTPFFKGYVSDWDARWNVIAQCVDDRTPGEKGSFELDDLVNLRPGDSVDVLSLAFETTEAKSIKNCNTNSWTRCKVSSITPTQLSVANLEVDGLSASFNIADRSTLKWILPGGVKTNPKHPLIGKSRFGTISTYISRVKPFREEYNDIECEIDDFTYKSLITAGVDETMAKHISHLFIRDPLVIYKDRVMNVDDERSTEHFENIQSTNWQNVRFKPPPLTEDVGFRVEFRTMEVQLTDFENAAFVIFITLLSRAILYYDLDLYMPLSKVDHNIQLAHKRNAAISEKFYFRKSFRQKAVINAIGLMSLKDIICGNEFRLGLSDICRQYLLAMCPNQQILNQVEEYIQHVERVASGLTPTCAQTLRTFVTNHELYKKDSVISDELCTEIIKHISGLRKRDLNCDDFKTQKDAKTARKTLRSGRSPQFRPMSTIFDSWSPLRKSPLLSKVNKISEINASDMAAMLI